MRFLRAFAAVSLSILLISCGGSLRPPAVGPGSNPNRPRFFEVDSAPRAATMHFPAGTYSLGAVDKIGYYYRAPRALIAAGGTKRSGGIFVSRRDPRKLRGYVYLASGITHVGNFSHVAHRFHD